MDGDTGAYADGESTKTEGALHPEIVDEFGTFQGVEQPFRAVINPDGRVESAVVP